MSCGRRAATAKEIVRNVRMWNRRTEPTESSHKSTFTIKQVVRTQISTFKAKEFKSRI